VKASQQTRRRLARIIGLALACALLASPAATSERHESGEMFDAAVRALSKGFHDRKFRQRELPALVERYRSASRAAGTRDEERQVIHDLLSNIPASHLALLSESTYRGFMGALAGKTTPTLGFELVRLEDGYYVPAVLEGGPAQRAGLRRGDRVLAIDGIPTTRSARLDWRSDDAYLPDPPAHKLHCRPDEVVSLEVERSPGQVIEIEILSRPYSTLDAARTSAHVFPVDGFRVAYIHFWFVHADEMDSILRSALRTKFKDADALMFDLRGRGGDGRMIRTVLDLLGGEQSPWNRPVVGLMDERTRSAKELLAHGLRKRRLGVLVGRTTAGAVLPASFKRVGPESILMFPASGLGRATELIEGSGVSPDIPVDSALPYAAGDDPILRVGLAVAHDLARATRR
jgi:carboxyl-terminal processing protease